ncbi:MAG: SNF2-related protein [Kiritimatiellia bacterium]
MNPAKLTKTMLIQWGGKHVYQQAEFLVKKGAVKKAEISDELISGVIARESASDLHTQLRVLTGGGVESLCPCYTHRNQGLVCPHIVALGISVMLRSSDPMREEKYQQEQRRNRRLATIDPATYIQRSPDGTPATLELSLSAAWAAEFHQDAIYLAIFFLIYDEIYHPGQIRADATLRLSQQDEVLLSVLEDICEGPPANPIQLNPADFINIVEIAGGKNFTTGEAEVLKVQKSYVQSYLRLSLDHTTGDLKIAPHSLLPEPAADERRRPLYLVSNKRGAVALDGQIWPMRNILPLPYHSIYRQDEIIPRPLVANFLRRDLPVLEKMTQLEMEVTPDLFDFSPAPPSFELLLRGNQAALRASLKASYQSHTFYATAPETQASFALPDPDDILRYHTRNPIAEAKALRMLRQLGFSHPNMEIPGEPALTMVGLREVLNFFGSGFSALKRAGWKISFSEKLEAIFDSLPVITPVIQISKKNEQWFDVGFEFETFDHPNLHPADIQRAINCGDSFVEVNGGAHLLDTAAVESMREVFRECQSKESQQVGHFMVPAVYAPFVQSSLRALDGIDVEEPADWREEAARRNRSTDARFKAIGLGALETTLRPYQKEGVYWLRFIEESGFNGILADEMGLGKTLQTLTWLNLKRIAPEARGKPALIICPTSLVENWYREAEKFVPQMRCLILSGAERHTLFDKIPEADIVITSYALIRRDLDVYQALTFSAAVLDEAQHIKNRSTRNAIAAKQINAINRVVLTGTPLENGVADIWSIMDFLMPQYLGLYEQFKINFETPIANGEREGELAQQKLRRMLNPFLLRRLKCDVAKDLPEKIIKIAFCPLALDQQRVYNELLADSRLKIKGLVQSKGFERSRFEILAMLMRLRQASCHLDLLKDHHTPGAYETPSSKLEAFLEILDEAIDGGHRILVFSQFVTFLKIIRRELDSRQIPSCYLDGSTKDRLAECRRFNENNSIPVFLISLKAGGTGLNLTGADMVVHMDPWWNPAAEDQATDRAHRIGQKRTVYSIKLIAEHTVEEKVLEMQRRKQALINATISASDEALIQKMTFNDISDIIGL